MKNFKQVTRMEDYKKWELDLSATLMANVIGIFFLLVTFLFILFTLTFIMEIENDNTQLIALIVYMFSVIKLLSIVGYPTLEYRPRKEETGE